MPTRHPESAQKASPPSSSPNEGPRQTAPDNTDFWVVCLCADWCHICRDWQHKFDPLVAAHATARALWLDIEDERFDDLNLDIETFPTLLIMRRDTALFLGPVPPVDEHINRLIAHCAQQDVTTSGTAAEQALAAHVWKTFIRA